MNNMKQNTLKTIGAMLLMAATAGHAEIAVVVHPDSSVSENADGIKNIFLGRSKRFSNGDEAIPVNIKVGDNTRIAFDRSMLDMAPAKSKGYWSRMVFTGKANPPKEVDTGQECINLVKSNKNVVCYCDASLVDGSIKVIHKI